MESAWANVKSFDQMLECNRAYISGDKQETPFYLGPLEPELDTLKPLLHELNDRELGFFSVHVWPSENSVVDGYVFQGRGCTYGFVQRNNASNELIKILVGLHPTFYVNVSLNREILTNNFPQRSFPITRSGKMLNRDVIWENSDKDEVLHWEGPYDRHAKESIGILENISMEAADILKDCYAIHLCAAEFGEGCAVKTLADCYDMVRRIIQLQVLRSLRII